MACTHTHAHISWIIYYSYRWSTNWLYKLSFISSVAWFNIMWRISKKVGNSKTKFVNHKHFAIYILYEFLSYHFNAQQNLNWLLESSYSENSSHVISTCSTCVGFENGFLKVVVVYIKVCFCFFSITWTHIAASSNWAIISNSVLLSTHVDSDMLIYLFCKYLICVGISCFISFINMSSLKIPFVFFIQLSCDIIFCFCTK